MLLRYFYHAKLAHASYLVGCQATGEAIVVDPGRHIEPYLAVAEDEKLRITAVAETHIHADFVSGARELAEQVGATLYLSGAGGDEWQYGFLDSGQNGYPHRLLHDQDTFRIGYILFQALHTPGHTPEHLSFLVTDARNADRPIGVFTGDFVFVGDVGRPDLLEKAAGIANTAVQGAGQLFHSLQRFKQFPDYLQIWPGHGAGSACGKNLGAVPSSTVGYEKLFNWALVENDKEAFTHELLSGQPEPPRYFGVMKRVNKEGPALLHGRSLPPQLPDSRVAELLARGAMVVDTRPSAAFAGAHIPGSINIPHNNSFNNWAGWLIDYDKPFYLITATAVLDEVVRDLQYVGLDNSGGYFEPSSALDTWQAVGGGLQSYKTANSKQLAEHILQGEVTLLDVRRQQEWQSGHIPGAQHIMLGTLSQRLNELPRDKPIVVQCATGRRSAIGASILQAHGIESVMNMLGGIEEWVTNDLPIIVEE